MRCKYLSSHTPRNGAHCHGFQSIFLKTKSLSASNLPDTIQFGVLRLWLIRARPCVVRIYNINRAVLLNKMIHFHRIRKWKKLLRTMGFLPTARYCMSTSSSAWGMMTCASQNPLLPERIQPWSEAQETGSLLPPAALCCRELSVLLLPYLLLSNQSFPGCVFR